MSLVSNNIFDTYNQIINDFNNLIKDYNNIINFTHYLITDKDYFELVDIIVSLIYDLIQENPLLYSEYNFHEEIINNIYDLLIINFIDLFDFHDDTTREDIIDVITFTYKTYFNAILTPRSFEKSFIKGKPNISFIEKQIDYLKNIPQPEQRTPEWYEFRQNILTASNIWKAFEFNASYNQLIYEKCIPLDINKYSHVSTESPLHWGQKYEPISIQWYEKNYNTEITDFGCIKHKNIDFLAASPDGINTCKKSERYGRMLEIKNIVNREITGIPKKEYWIQMQVQMEVCELNECDFLETKFFEYENEDDFNNDGNFNYSENNSLKGIFIYFIKDSQPFYEYPPILSSKYDFEIWESGIMAKHNELTWMKNIYWRLDKISCVLVPRNFLWFSEAKNIIEKLWNTIKYERINGFEHRIPKKRVKHNKLSDNSFNNTSTGCIINISTEKFEN